MARKTPIDRLGEAVQGILEEHQDDIEKNLDLITQQMGKEGAKALRQQSKKVIKGPSWFYAPGWKYAYRKTKRYHKTTVFNEHYSLPHLLEHGHATRNGDGREYPDTPGHEHIATVAEPLVEAYEREVLSKL